MTEDVPSIDELQDRLRQLQAFMDHSPAAAYMKDEAGRYVYSSERMSQMFYAPLAGLEGKTDFDWLPEYMAAQIWQSDQEVLHSGNPIELVETIPTPDGRLTYWLVFKFPFTNARAEKFVGAVAVDITQLKETEARLKELTDQLENLSLTDELTGLNNRRGFLHLADDRIKVAHRNDESLLLLFADMDGLKQINDNYGHTAGSQAIAMAADILRDSFRQSDVMARWGGDEFIVLMVQASNETEAVILKRLRTKIAEFNASSGWPYKLSMSMGVTPVELDGRRVLNDFIMEADKAMYENKRSRRKD